MKSGLHNLPKMKKAPQRLGRGIGSRGAKSGRGMKGQKSRAGYTKRAGFEGGQTPLYQRTPKKRGAKADQIKKLGRQVMIGTKYLEKLPEGMIVGPGALKKEGKVASKSDRIRLVNTGEIKKKMTVRVHGASKGAVCVVEKAGGKVEIINSRL